MTTKETTPMCAAGRDTEHPCPRPAVTADQRPAFCGPHLRVVLMQGLVSEIETVLSYSLAEVKAAADDYRE